MLGGKYIYYFLTTLERGHMQVLPLAYDVRSRLPAMLASIGRPDRDDVFCGLPDPPPGTVSRSCEGAPLLKALQDASPLIRSSALNAPSGNWSADTPSALTRAARDEYRVVRIQAGAVLAALIPERDPRTSTSRRAVPPKSTSHLS